MFRAVLPDGRIRDLNTQFGQFRLDASAAPGGIGFPHLLGQCDELAIQGGSSHASSGFPVPEQAKAQAMPSDDGLRLEEQQDLLPVRPEAPQTHPEQSVGGVSKLFKINLTTGVATAIVPILDATPNDRNIHGLESRQELG